MNRAVHLYARSQARREWRSRLRLVLLLGATGAVSLGAAAGAIRTNSAVERFLGEQRAFDALVFCGSLADDGGACEQELSQVAEIESVASLIELPGVPFVADRSAEPADDNCFDGPGDVKLVVAPDGRFGSSINELRLIEGRRADPTRPEEIVVGRDIAKRVGLGLGDTIDFQHFDGADCLDEPSAWGPTTSLTVVGIEVSPFEIRPDSGEYRSFLHGTPALLAAAGDVPDAQLMMAVRLRPGLEYDDLAAPFEAIEISTQIADVEGERFAVPQTVNSDNLQRSLRAHVTALWLVSALAAAAGLLLVGQSLNRQVRGAAPELAALRHLGMTGGELSRVGLVHVGSIALPASVVAALGAYLISGFTPLGLARVIEVDAGLRVDRSVLVLGTIAVLAALVIAAVPSLLAATRSRPPRPSTATGLTSRVARELGGHPVTSTGVRMAFEPIRGPLAPPVRTGFGVVLASVVLFVAAVVFTGSISHLRSSEHLFGWNWDAVLSAEDGSVSDADLRAVLEATPGVRSATSGTMFPPALILYGSDEALTITFAFDGGPIGPTLISGRAPSRASEVALGREFLARLGAHEGDKIDFVATVFDEDGRAAQASHGELTIVGTAVLPAIGGSDRLGTGAAVDFEFLRALLPNAQAGAVFVHLEPGARLDDVASAVKAGLDLDEIGIITEETFGLDQSVRDVERIQHLPIPFAIALALLAVGVVTQVVVGSTYGRRSEFGVLRAVGLGPRQIRGVIIVQGLAVSGAALLFGIPLGLAAGSAAWRVYALSLGTRPEVSLTLGWLALIAIGFLAIASTLGLVCTTRARRRVGALPRRG